MFISMPTRYKPHQRVPLSAGTCLAGTINYSTAVHFVASPLATAMAIVLPVVELTRLAVHPSRLALDHAAIPRYSFRYPSC